MFKLYGIYMVFESSLNTKYLRREILKSKQIVGIVKNNNLME